MRLRTGRRIGDVAVIVALIVLECAILHTHSLAQQGSATRGLAIKTESLPAGTAQQDYHFQLEAIGGTSPLHWPVASGELPLVMSLEQASGVSSGGPRIARA